MPTEILVHYVVSSLMAQLTWWLDHDSPYSPEQMDQMYRQLAKPGVDATLHQLSVKSR